MLAEILASVITLALLLYAMIYKMFTSKTQYWAQKGVAQYKDIQV